MNTGTVIIRIKTPGAKTKFWEGAKIRKAKISIFVLMPVADPGFPVGGRGPVRGAWTSNVDAFWQKYMQKLKNLAL